MPTYTRLICRLSSNRVSLRARFLVQELEPLTLAKTRKLSAGFINGAIALVVRLLTIVIGLALLAPASLCQDISRSGAHERGQKAIQYTVRVGFEQKDRLQVRLQLPRSPGISMDLEIPAWTPGYYQILHYEKHIVNLSAYDGNGKALPVRRSSARSWTVATKNVATDTIEVRYAVTTNEREASEKDPGLFGTRIDVQNRSVYINTASAFLYSPSSRTLPVQLKLEVPDGYNACVPLPSIDTATYSATDYDELIDSPIQLGTFATTEFTLGNVKFKCVVSPAEHANLAGLQEVVRRIAQKAIELFGAVPFADYTFIFHVGEFGFQGGLEHRRSTVIDIDGPIGATGSDDFLITTAHELLHAWNVKTIRPDGLGPFDYSQPVRTPSLWFAEGVTDYYAALILVRSGLRDMEWFWQLTAQRIRLVDATLMASSISLEQASMHAWEGRSEGFRGVNYYVKGSLIGLYFDLRLRALTGGKSSLDDVMRSMNRAFGEAGRSYPPSALLKTINDCAGIDLKEEYARLVGGVAEVPWSDVFEPAGISLVRERSGFLGVEFSPAPDPDSPESEYAFDGSSPAPNAMPAISVVEKGSPAENMGLKIGDTVVRINGLMVDYTTAGSIVRTMNGNTLISITVRRNGALRTFTGTTGTRYTNASIQFDESRPLSAEKRTLRNELFVGRVPGPHQNTRTTLPQSPH